MVEAKLPIAVEMSPLAVVDCPIAVEANPLAVVDFPIAVEANPLATVKLPIAVEKTPLAVVLEPIAVELSPMLASSHSVPSALPARNAALRGYHMRRVPAPLTVKTGLAKVPSATNGSDTPEAGVCGSQAVPSQPRTCPVLGVDEDTALP